jgi:Ca-activated chloride channel family protein
MSFTYDGNDFPANAGGENFLARLWATRRIGDLLNTIRLNGENDELVDSVVNLSVRYGIITPYTSFLIEEDDILTQDGRNRITNNFATEAEALAMDNTGASAVDAAEESQRMQAAQAPMSMMTATPLGTLAPGDADGELDDRFDGNERNVNPIQLVGGKTFILQSGVWTDTTFQPDTMETQKVEFLSDAYFDLLLDHPELGDFFALGEQVIVVMDGTAYEVFVA